MATIATGTGSTFKAITAEGRAVEVLCYLQIQEAIEANNSSARNAVTGTFDTDDKTFNGTYSLPANQSISSSGSLSINATSYLTNVVIAPGSGEPTFKSATLEAYLLEVLMYLQVLERDSAKNPQNRNYITGSFNSDTGLYQGTFNLPVTFSLDATGKPEFSAVEYLSS